MRGPMAFVRGMRHPEAFHGRGVTRGFFEGWYVKLVDAGQRARWAVIPGVFRGQDGSEVTDEAFVQVLDGATGRSWYHRYDVADFHASVDAFEVQVGVNRFSADGVHLDLPELRGEIRFTGGMDPWPITWRRPGIMGPYSWVPLMECYHGVVSFGHALEGALTHDGATQDFSGGRGYIEKDWGRAFPAGYVWMHSNHLEQAPEASLVASVAIIPWLRSSFRGYIVGLRLGRRLHVWATYNGSIERSLEIDSHRVHWILEGPSGTLELAATRVRGGLLHAPVRTRMHERVEETLDATLTVRLTSPTGELLLDTMATSAGLEVHGDLDRLLAVGTR